MCWGEEVTPHHGAEEVSSAAQEVMLREVRAPTLSGVWH